MITQKLKDFVNAMSLEGLAIPTAHLTTIYRSASPDFSIEDLPDCYRINGIEYKGNISSWDISKTLLPAGTQDEHAKRRKQALIDGTFYTPDFPLFHGILNTLQTTRVLLSMFTTVMV